MIKPRIDSVRIALQGESDGKTFRAFKNLMIYSRKVISLSDVKQTIIEALVKKYDFIRPKAYKIPETLPRMKCYDLEDFIIKGYAVTKQNVVRQLKLHKNEWEEFAELNKITDL